MTPYENSAQQTNIFFFWLFINIVEYVAYLLIHTHVCTNISNANYIIANTIFFKVID